MNSDEYAAWLKSLKAGDEVMVMRFDEPVRIRKVVAVTKSGRVRINRYLNIVTGTTHVEYDSDGTVRGEHNASRFHMGEFERTSIGHATKEAREKLRAIVAELKRDEWSRKIRQGLVSGISWADANSLSDDQLRAVEAILWPPKPTTEPTP